MTWDGLTPPYATIVADPPWAYGEGWPPFSPTSNGDIPRRRKLPYSAMPVEDIAALPVADLAAPGSTLFLWTTSRYLWDARDIALGWGFTPAEVLVWCKEPIGVGPGGMFSVTTEYVVIARSEREARQVARAGALIRQARDKAKITRSDLHRLVRGGKPTGIVARWEEDDSLPNAADWARLQAVLPALRGIERPYVPPPPSLNRAARIGQNWFVWPRGAHSEKPAAFLDLVEQVSPGPYVELFARQPRLGWDSWGHGYEQGGAA